MHRVAVKGAGYDSPGGMRRKRLGQFFSGPKVARLLASLCKVGDAMPVLDPMVGSGDLLAACARDEMSMHAGIEIDSELATRCASRLSAAKIVQGSAFDPFCLRTLPHRAWSRVLANPPYVRYQSLSKRCPDRLVHSAADVRTHLLEALNECSALDDLDLQAFRTLVANYSGLSDLAVPSVILCAALTARDGVLGLVMPEAWLSRDYAAPVHYLLDRWFQIEAIVEDAHATWFENALVKTTLVIARRIPCRETTLTETERTSYPYVRLSGDAADIASLVGRRYPGTIDAEKAFVDDIDSWREQRPHEYGPFVDVSWITPPLQVQRALAAVRRMPWLSALEPQSRLKPDECSVARLPAELSAWVEQVAADDSFVDLAALGIAVGQGLRTGANEFFYAGKESEDGQITQIGPLKLLHGRSLSVPSEFLQPAIKRQADLPEGYLLRPRDARTVVIDLADAWLPEDIDRSDVEKRKVARRIDPRLAELVRAASQANFGTPQAPRRIWEMSAVVPSRNRLWYQLPPFTDRHRPHIAIPRVNHRTPFAYLNEGRALLIDANFSSLWLTKHAIIDEFALLALLHSLWMRVAMELTASVMGGGAAKLEATHLRYLPVPGSVAVAGEALSQLGKDLVDGGANVDRVRREIDLTIAKCLGGSAGPDLGYAALLQIEADAQKRRMRISPLK